jgi:hypothetical protein
MSGATQVLSALSLSQQTEFYLFLCSKVTGSANSAPTTRFHLRRKRKKSEEEGAWYREKERKHERHPIGRALRSGSQHSQINTFSQ